jgi:ankyrin repeat protein
VQLLVNNGADVNAEGGLYGSPIQAALAGGYEEIVQLLVDNGANVDAEGGHYGSPLQGALAEGDHNVV